MARLSRSALLLAAAVAAAVACQRKPDTGPSAAATTKVSVANVKPPELSPEQKLTQDVEKLAEVIKMPEDYAVEAEIEIGNDNLEAELAKVEAELSSVRDSAPRP